MQEDQDELLSSEDPTTTEDVSPPAPEPAVDRDEQGRFKAKETGEEPSEPPSPEPEPKGDDRVPLHALKDEREKRQQAERQLETYRREMEARQRPQEPQQVPDPIEDAPAYSQYMERKFGQQMVKQKLDMSRFMAEREFGAEEVAAAYAYFDQNPQQSWALMSEPSPFHAAVEHYRRGKIASEVGSDPAQYREKLRKELEAEIRAQLASENPERPKAPPRSLTDAPSSGPPKDTGRSFDPLLE